MPESVVHLDAAPARVAVSKIQELGAAVTLEGFGTGYSNLLYLNRYPVRCLKVDRQFVAAIGMPGGDAMVTSIVDLGRAVGAWCLADGVDTAAQFEVVTAAGCRYAQGGHLGAPVPAQQVPEAVRRCTELLGALE